MNLPPGRRRAFTVIALSLPLLFLLLLEGALRLADYAPREPLFIPVENAPGDYLQPNEKVVQRFFAHPLLAPKVTIDTSFFPAEKPADAFRIVVQGGSSAAGFPFGKFASPAGMLKHRLRRSFPDKDIEVITTAMSAVNSYALLDFADEIIAIEPDAVLIYAGHNEYLGVLGVGSAFSSARAPFLTRLTLGLQDWKLFRLIQRTGFAVTGGADKAKQRPPGTLMARIAAERTIPYASELFDAGVEQFRYNMSALLERYRRAGIPVMIATLASNWRDQPPFSSGLAEGTDRERWQALYDQSRGAFDRRELEQARVGVADSLALDDASAEAHYLAAQVDEALGDTEAARRHYAAAKDRDRLRFRAPEAINAAIRELAREHEAILVDVAALMEQRSRHGILGDDLMVEHLHPNARGYFLLSDAFYDAMREAGWIGAWKNPLEEEAAWNERTLTEVGRLGGEYRVMQLKADWPFQETKQSWSLPTPEDEIQVIAQNWFLKRITWLDAMNQALAHYQRTGNLDEAVRVALNLADAFVFLDDAQFVAGQMLLRQGHPRRALRYTHRAATLAPRKERNLLALAQAFYQSGSPEKSRQTLERLLEIDPGNARATHLLRQLDGSE